MLSAQVTGGAGLPLVKFTHNAGHEDTPDDDSYVKATGHPSYRADDALWLFPTVEKYIGETGDTAFLDEVVPYANAQEDTVYEHLKRAIEFSAKNLGIHGLPAGLHADWNDCLRLGKDGETVFVAFQLFMALGILRDYAAEKDDSDYAGYCEKFRIKLSEALEKAWNGQWFVRGFINSGADKGKVIGNKGDAEAEIWLNPQSWSVISGFARDERGRQAMAAADKALNTPYGLKLFDPPYDKCFFEGALMPVFNLDVKENGGIFSQPQGWAILSSALLGDGNKAFEYFMETSPAAMNAKAEIRVIEPYAHGQFTESRRSPYEGRSHVHWLTGTASTVMVGCVEGICGMRPVSEGIVIDPSIPAEWDGFKIEKTFRGRKLYITVENPNHSQSGVKEMYLNGKLITGNLIPEADLTDVNDIKVILI
jgi:cellobiose phosphorylase